MFVLEPNATSLDSNAKGDIAELEITLAAVRLGIPVLKPLSGHARYDLGFDVGERIWRVQCKWGRLSEDRTAVIVRTGTASTRPGGYRRTTYTEDQVDLFAVYCGALDRCFLFPVELALGKHYMHLRLAHPRNNQSACINVAANFELPGAIAQLGERLAGSQKVAGSSPASSTAADCTPTYVGCNPFRDRFGEWIERVVAGEQVIVTRRGKPLLRLSRPDG